MKRSLYRRGDYSLVRESGVPQRARPMCAGVPEVLSKYTDSVLLAGLPWSGARAGFAGGMSFRRKLRDGRKEHDSEREEGITDPVQPHCLAWAHASAPCRGSWPQKSLPTFFSTFAASCSRCPKLPPLSLELLVEFSAELLLSQGLSPPLLLPLGSLLPS